jgi:cytidine deaminase
MSLPTRSNAEIIPVSGLDAKDQALCKKAAEAAGAAYEPYSKFSVGAAVRTRSGAIYAGSNLENASYGVGICAEVSALTAANSAGDFDVEAIAIVGYPNDNPAAGSAIVTPCGRCRQIIFEASQVSGQDVKVIACNGDLTKCRIYSISELLPDGFGPANLGMDVAGYQAKHRAAKVARVKRA